MQICDMAHYYIYNYVKQLRFYILQTLKPSKYTCLCRTLSLTQLALLQLPLHLAAVYLEMLRQQETGIQQNMS